MTRPKKLTRENLDDEITMLREMSQAVRALAGEVDLNVLEMKDVLHLLDVLGRTATRLSTLLRSQRSLAEDAEDGRDPLSRVLDGVIRRRDGG